jgi:deoxyribose-phosphate aldolase
MSWSVLLLASPSAPILQKRNLKKRDVGKDIWAVVDAARGCPVKVILETCYLTEEEKIRACKPAIEAGAAFVKTSTGFGSGGATIEAHEKYGWKRFWCKGRRRDSNA